MSDYYATTKTSLFSVTDTYKLRQLCEDWNVELEEYGDYKFAIHPPDGGFGTWKDIDQFDDDGNEILTNDDFFEELSKLLPENEILICWEVGNESRRYVEGFVFAMNNKNEYLSLFLSDEIYKKIDANWKNAKYSKQ